MISFIVNIPETISFWFGNVAVHNQMLRDLFIQK